MPEYHDPDLRLFCDEMLHRLGRWLRAAGYDTVIAEPGSDDHDIAARAAVDNRWLVTRDRHLARFRDLREGVILLGENDVPALAAELTARLPIDWLARPLSRCLECNTPLVDARPDQVETLPPGALSVTDRVRYCPGCGRLYWEGSHTRRMRHTLENFARGEWTVATD